MQSRQCYKLLFIIDSYLKHKHVLCRNSNGMFIMKLISSLITVCYKQFGLPCINSVNFDHATIRFAYVISDWHPIEIESLSLTVFFIFASKYIISATTLIFQVHVRLAVPEADQAVKIPVFPLTLPVIVTTVLHYRAACCNIM